MLACAPITTQIYILRVVNLVLLSLHAGWPLIPPLLVATSSWLDLLRASPESCKLECGVVLRLLVIELVSVCPRGIPRLSCYVVRRRMDRDLSVYEMNALAVKLAR